MRVLESKLDGFYTYYLAWVVKVEFLDRDDEKNSN